jgi:hypothetical protein
MGALRPPSEGRELKDRRNSNCPLGGSPPSPISAEIDAWLVRHRVTTSPVRLPAMILAPRRFLREADQVWAGDTMVVSHFAAPQPAKEAFGLVGVVFRTLSRGV